MPTRAEIDVVVPGASDFTRRLVSEHLARFHDHDLRWLSARAGLTFSNLARTGEMTAPVGSEDFDPSGHSTARRQSLAQISCPRASEARVKNAGVSPQVAI